MRLLDHDAVVVSFNDQAHVLRNLGYALAQGYHFARALDADAAPAASRARSDATATFADPSGVAVADRTLEIVSGDRTLVEEAAKFSRTGSNMRKPVAPPSGLVG